MLVIVDEDTRKILVRRFHRRDVYISGSDIRWELASFGDSIQHEDFRVLQGDPSYLDRSAAIWGPC